MEPFSSVQPFDLPLSPVLVLCSLVPGMLGAELMGLQVHWLNMFCSVVTALHLAGQYTVRLPPSSELPQSTMNVCTATSSHPKQRGVQGPRFPSEPLLVALCCQESFVSGS